MADLTLITANKNYCLWPLPVWLCLKIAELEFDEIVIPFGDPDARERFLQLTPMGSVSALKHGDLTLWDSLAICEYVAELSPEAGPRMRQSLQHRASRSQSRLQRRRR